MKTINTLIVLVLLAFVSNVQAQTSGYLGKRLLVSLDFDLAPDVAILVDGIPEYRSWIHRKQGLGLSYVVKNKRAIGFYLNHYRNIHQDPVFSTIFFNRDYAFTSGEGVDNFSDLLDPLSDYVRTKITEVGISYQYYLNSFVAPVGKYIELEMGAVIGKSEFYDERVRAAFEQPASVSKSAVSPKVSIAYMQNHIIQDKFVIRYGYEFGWDMGGSMAAYRLNTVDYVHFTNERYMGNRALVRSLYASIFNFKLGIGLIP